MAAEVPKTMKAFVIAETVGTVLLVSYERTVSNYARPVGCQDMREGADDAGQTWRGARHQCA